MLTKINSLKEHIWNTVVTRTFYMYMTLHKDCTAEHLQPAKILCEFLNTYMERSGLMHKVNQARVLRRVALLAGSWLALESWPLGIFKLIQKLCTLRTLATLYCSVQMVCANNVIHGKHLLSFWNWVWSLQPVTRHCYGDNQNYAEPVSLIHSASAAAGRDEACPLRPLGEDSLKLVPGRPTSETPSPVDCA